MTDPDIDDLLGPDPAEVSAPAVYDLREVHGGVSLSWLAQVFKMDRQTIKRRLAHYPPIRRHAVLGIRKLIRSAPVTVSAPFGMPQGPLM